MKGNQKLVGKNEDGIIKATIVDKKLCKECNKNYRMNGSARCMECSNNYKLAKHENDRLRNGR